ncbi:U4/U6.U5 snRNP associated protein [Coemansia sp. RSA 552]|nr:U4/U6.U5 snRNP associated protein [Coemansia sp. RSA 552]
MGANAYGNAKGESFRRQWDSSTYEKKAQDREQQLREEEDNEDRRRKGLKPRPPRSQRQTRDPPELLQARKSTIDLERMVGKTQVVQSSDVASGQPGFYCKACDVTVKDSLSYLNHINGKKHQRVLNRVMKVHTETVDDVLAKLQSLREARRRRQQQDASEYDFHEQVRIQHEVEQAKKQKRKEARKRHRQAKASADASVDAAPADDVGDGDGSEPDAMAAMMGFSSFASSKK